MAPAAAPCLVACALLLLSAVPAAAHSIALQPTFPEDVVGSGEAEGSSASSPSPPPSRSPALGPTSAGPQPTGAGGPAPPTNLLDGIVDFFRQYAMLIAVVGSLALLLMFIVCAAVVTRQKHKASAYYPSSFPKKKYVDQRDRAGGPCAFSEVPDRAPDGRAEDALDSSQQLQADILAASQNLKSPAKAAPGGGDAARKAEGRPEPAAAAEEEGGSQGAPGSPAEQRGPAGEPPEGGPAAAEGPGEPAAAPLPAQEAGEPAGAPESPCACGSVTPSD
ncbi:transmembrane protein 119 [Dasypus novemcinctus]|uniref:transmembrane protein 119 n=1 Tax=Dasypus novemcinctus TaxID=9361 RepID=UPI0003289AF0|nr:transmembrane protein 119 [Dasypus novemcinctus]